MGKCMKILRMMSRGSDWSVLGVTNAVAPVVSLSISLYMSLFSASVLVGQSKPRLYTLDEHELGGESESQDRSGSFTILVPTHTDGNASQSGRLSFGMHWGDSGVSGGVGGSSTSAVGSSENWANERYISSKAFVVVTGVTGLDGGFLNFLGVGGIGDSNSAIRVEEEFCRQFPGSSISTGVLVSIKNSDGDSGIAVSSGGDGFLRWPMLWPWPVVRLSCTGTSGSLKKAGGGGSGFFVLAVETTDLLNCCFADCHALLPSRIFLPCNL